MKNKYTKKRFEICELQICPFDIIKTQKGNLYKADRNNFPYRLCVFDTEEKKAIDVELEVSYDYIEMSTVYFLGTEAKKIEKEKRYAILPISFSHLKYPKSMLRKAEEFVDRLTSGEEFIDGNIYDNENYLKMINSKEKQKVKKR